MVGARPLDSGCSGGHPEGEQFRPAGRITGTDLCGQSLGGCLEGFHVRPFRQGERGLGVGQHGTPHLVEVGAAGLPDQLLCLLEPAAHVGDVTAGDVQPGPLQLRVRLHKRRERPSLQQSAEKAVGLLPTAEPEREVRGDTLESV
jgi:hypothetical protein